MGAVSYPHPMAEPITPSPAAPVTPLEGSQAAPTPAVAPVATPPQAQPTVDPAAQVEQFKSQVNGLKQKVSEYEASMQQLKTAAASVPQMQAEVSKHRLMLEASDSLDQPVAKAIRAAMENRTYASEEEAQSHFDSLRAFAQELGTSAPVQGSGPASPPVTSPAPTVPPTDDAAGTRVPPAVSRDAMTPDEKLKFGLKQQHEAKTKRTAGAYQ